MLHTKFQNHLEKKIFKGFIKYGHCGYLGHVIKNVWRNFRSPDPWRLHIKCVFNWPTGFWDIWKCWRRTDNGRTTDAYLYHKLTHEPSAQVSFKVVDMQVDGRQSNFGSPIMWGTYLGSWMTTCLGKSCSFSLPSVPFVNCCKSMYLVISLLVLRARYGIWLIIAYLFTFLTQVW